MIRRDGIAGSDELGPQRVTVVREGPDVLIQDMNEFALAQVGQKAGHVAPMSGHVVDVDRMMFRGDDRGIVSGIAHVVRIETRLGDGRNLAIGRCILTERRRSAAGARQAQSLIGKAVHGDIVLAHLKRNH